MTTAERIERCRECELAIRDHCQHRDATVWESPEFVACFGYQPWCWQVEHCPLEGGNGAEQDPE
jgi:hypothetical protein